MNPFEQSVYKKYRHHLAHHNRPGVGDRNSRAAQRRQAARVAVVEQFNIPFAEVKRIVALGDAATGVTHEAPKEYSPYASFEFKRVPMAEVQVGDRIVYAHGLDARIVHIDGNTLTFRGVVASGGKSHEWTSTIRSENGIMIVANRARRVPAQRS